MPEFTTSTPSAIPITTSSFLRMFGSGGVDVASLFIGVSQASHTFTTTFPGVLVPTQAVPHASLVADIGSDLNVPWSQWANRGSIPDGTVIVIKADPSFVDALIGTLADFVSAPGSITVASAVLTGTTPQPISVTSASFTPNPPRGEFLDNYVAGAVLSEEGSMLKSEDGKILTAN